MGRKRMAMELISNKRARLTSFEKRKKGLKKAAYELSTLCGVEIGMIIVCNDDHEVWPPNWDTLARMTKMHKLGSSRDGKCKTYGVVDYFKEKREEVEQEIKKMREKARERKYAMRGDEFQSSSEDQLRELGTFLKAKIAAVRETINTRVFAPKIEQQQILAYNNSYANLREFRNPYLNTKFIMNPYIPEIIQQDQNLADYEAENNVGDQNEEIMKMMMMERDGASCSEGMYDFDGSQDSYAYFLNENCFQNCGPQEMMENVVNGVEPLMSYEDMLLLNWQGDFPEIQADQGFYV